MVYTVEEVADILKVSPQTVRALIKRGEMKAVRVGGQIRIRQQDLDEYLNSHPA